MKRNNASSLKHTIAFYALLVSELICLPWLSAREVLKKRRKTAGPPLRRRPPVASKQVYVCVHEWGGYPMRRQKTIKHGATFDCGLEAQLERFSPYRASGRVELTVTLSAADRHPDLSAIRNRTDHLILSCNKGMDFSGYAAFFDRIKNKPDAYVILTNSSVNAAQNDFLESYIRCMERHHEIGMLGISYCTRMFQSLVRNNFTPHLQSFFLLTTTSVLREIVASNQNRFPGAGIGHKLLLIRKGEVALSRLVLRLGYRLAVIRPENGALFLFTDYRRWNIPRGDIRQTLSEPNKITEVRL